MSHPNIIPAIRYRDADTALDWLQRAFGAEPKDVHRSEGRIQHAEILIGEGMLMFGMHDDAGWMEGHAPDALASTISLYVVVPDPDAHHDRAKEAGAKVVRPLQDTPYGSREYSVRDLEGNLWSFGTYDPYARNGSSGAVDDH